MYIHIYIYRCTYIYIYVNIYTCIYGPTQKSPQKIWLFCR